MLVRTCFFYYEMRKMKIKLFYVSKSLYGRLDFVTNEERAS